MSEPAQRDLLMIAHCLRIEGYEMVAHEFTTYLAAKTGYRPVAQEIFSMLEGHTAAKKALNALQDEVLRAANPFLP